jgi:hypothetical protein
MDDPPIFEDGHLNILKQTDVVVAFEKGTISNLKISTIRAPHCSLHANVI